MAMVHGHAKRGTYSRAYRAWTNMKNRCDSPRHPRYADWGGRGITYCNRWKLFQNFLADMGPPPEGMTLERLENDGNYGPDNCAWRSRRAQSNNKRDTVRIECAEKTLSQTEWARELGLGETTVQSRLRRGHDIETALLPTTFQGCKELIEFKGRRQSIAQWAREIGIKPDTLYKRIRKGRSFEDAMRM